MREIKATEQAALEPPPRGVPITKIKRLVLLSRKWESSGEPLGRPLAENGTPKEKWSFGG